MDILYIYVYVWMMYISYVYVVVNANQLCVCIFIYLICILFFGNAMHFIWPNLASDLFSPPFVIITASEIVVKARTVIVCDCR